jgi:hypothetical protein
MASPQLLMHVFDAPGVGLASWQTLTPQLLLSLEPIAGYVRQSRYSCAVRFLLRFAMCFANHPWPDLSRLLQSVVVRGI